MFHYSADQLAELIPTNKNYLDWYYILQDELPKFEIDTKNRVASFISQCGHESADFRILTENLNYSADGLLATFPKYFKTKEHALAYHRQPERIANYVYGNRMGNGPENSGEGWKYRGRGLIQITGKYNYNEASKFIFNDSRVVDDPDYFSSVAGAIQSACWFWKANSCNQFADIGDVYGLTRRITGHYNGLDERIKRYDKAIQIL